MIDKCKFDNIYKHIAAVIYIGYVYKSVLDGEIKMDKTNGKNLKLSKYELERVRMNFFDLDEIKIIDHIIDANDTFLDSMKFKLFSNNVDYDAHLLDNVICLLSDFVNFMRRKLSFNQYDTVKQYAITFDSFARGLGLDFLFLKD